uniref:Predicted protein putative n=1 Tax=Albugo laibachii Nc14 TaxID=890382 RepID=F0WJR0_9STRA|nr:predicted protein putative [Albugo laibachii Nc14]|eukprot:CCA21511.1 predicted protein putative [Albugo laibachii Nc14]
MNSDETSRKEPSAAAPSGEAQDLTVFVQTLLEQMQNRFSQMSDAIIGRIDDMGTRIDELEKSIGDLMDQTNDEATSSLSSLKVTNTDKNVESKE